MPDLNEDVIYRGFNVNSITVTPDGPLGGGIVGCKLDSMTTDEVETIQFTERRAQQDGLDAGRPFAGARRIRMAGTLYAATAALLYDALRDFRAAFNSVLSYREAPEDKGYQPLYFSEPTNRIAEFPSGAIDMRVLAMTQAISYTEQDSALGGDGNVALSIPWTVSMMCVNPAIMGELPVDIPLTATVDITTTPLANRGSYLAAINGLWVVTAAAGTITATIGGSQFVITVPASTGTRTIRMNGMTQDLTVQEGSVSTPRRGWIDFPGGATWPLIPPGASDYAVTFGGSLALVGSPGDSHIWFWETYA